MKVGTFKPYGPICAALVALSGCATSPMPAPIEDRKPVTATAAVPQPQRPTAPAVAPPVSAPRVFALPDSAETRVSPLPGAPAPAAASESPIAPPADPALRELVARAEQASNQGDTDAARATLERALKINPRDASLWYRMAELDYARGEFEQAIVTAERARTLATKDPELLARIDALSARARSRLGANR
jgi:Flp pilus assembly protein TadD